MKMSKKEAIQEAKKYLDKEVKSGESSNWKEWMEDFSWELFFEELRNYSEHAGEYDMSECEFRDLFMQIANEKGLVLGSKYLEDK